MNRIIGTVLFASAFAGCVSAPFQPPVGVIAVDKAPLSLEGNWRISPKCGKASVQSVLGLYSWGDCTITAAAEQGGLKKVNYLDYEYTNVIGIWQKVTVSAYGE